ncbi:MAG TPA: hypothetical protein V6D47_02175 [Oscillatoriaceae cyanobacterium]
MASIDNTSAAARQAAEEASKRSAIEVAKQVAEQAAKQTRRQGSAQGQAISDGLQKDLSHLGGAAALTTRQKQAAQTVGDVVAKAGGNVDVNRLAPQEQEAFQTVGQTLQQDVNRVGGGIGTARLTLPGSGGTPIATDIGQAGTDVSSVKAAASATSHAVNLGDSVLATKQLATGDALGAAKQMAPTPPEEQGLLTRVNGKLAGPLSVLGIAGGGLAAAKGADELAHGNVKQGLADLGSGTATGTSGVANLTSVLQSGRASEDVSAIAKAAGPLGAVAGVVGGVASMITGKTLQAKALGAANTTSSVAMYAGRQLAANAAEAAAEGGADSAAAAGAVEGGADAAAAAGAVEGGADAAVAAGAVEGGAEAAAVVGGADAAGVLAGVGGEEAAAAALDATGIGAVVGVPLQIGGALVAAGALAYTYRHQIAGAAEAAFHFGENAVNSAVNTGELVVGDVADTAKNLASGAVHTAEHAASDVGNAAKDVVTLGGLL